MSETVVSSPSDSVSDSSSLLPVSISLQSPSVMSNANESSLMITSVSPVASSSTQLVSLVPSDAEGQASSISPTDNQFAYIKGFTYLGENSDQPTYVNLAVDKDSVMKLFMSLGQQTTETRISTEATEAHFSQLLESSDSSSTTPSDLSAIPISSNFLGEGHQLELDTFETEKCHSSSAITGGFSDTLDRIEKENFEVDNIVKGNSDVENSNMKSVENSNLKVDDLETFNSDVLHSRDVDPSVKYPNVTKLEGENLKELSEEKVNERLIANNSSGNEIALNEVTEFDLKPFEDSVDKPISFQSRDVKNIEDSEKYIDHSTQDQLDRENADNCDEQERCFTTVFEISKGNTKKIEMDVTANDSLSDNDYKNNILPSEEQSQLFQRDLSCETNSCVQDKTPIDKKMKQVEDKQQINKQSIDNLKKHIDKKIKCSDTKRPESDTNQQQIDTEVQQFITEKSKTNIQKLDKCEKNLETNTPENDSEKKGLDIIKVEVDVKTKGTDIVKEKR